MTITYQLKFLGYWHCGSGLSGGAEADAGVIKDAQGLPFVPGKTIKGLLKDAAFEMVQGNTEKQNLIDILFGYTAMSATRGDGGNGKASRTHAGSASFSNAELPLPERMEAAGELSHYLYDILASTSIDEKTGTAENQTLRSIEVVVPLTLHGSIRMDACSDEEKALLKACLKWVRAAGAHRNRGLGRCVFTNIN